MERAASYMSHDYTEALERVVAEFRELPGDDPFWKSMRKSQDDSKAREAALEAVDALVNDLSADATDAEIETTREAVKAKLRNLPLTSPLDDGERRKGVGKLRISVRQRGEVPK